jgi:trafficking protein particle complex subunit 5
VGKTIPISTFGALYAEMISYHRQRTTTLSELDARLSDAGVGVGYRLFEMLSLKTGRRELTTITILNFVCGTAWTALFGRTADHLDVNKEGSIKEYRIWDPLPATSSFISLPRECSRFNPACFIGGIIKGMLEGGGFVSFRSTFLLPICTDSRGRPPLCFFLRLPRRFIVLFFLPLAAALHDIC